MLWTGNTVCYLYVTCTVYIGMYITCAVLICFTLHQQEGRNALHFAANFGSLESVKYLLPKFGPKKFDVDSHGHSCLTLAIEEEHHDVVDWLLESD